MQCECEKAVVSWAILQDTEDEDFPFLWWLLCDLCAMGQAGRVFTIAEYEAMKTREGWKLPV